MQFLATSDAVHHKTKESIIIIHMGPQKHANTQRNP